ncbi:MAG: hypothetical protein HRU15_14140, partial [Planctomycetes bacterium]|nr:hypothetical protein [Planctomycetota bacterium]
LDASISHSGDQPLLDFLIHKANMINDEQAEQMRQRAEAQDLQVDVIGVKLEFFTEDELVNALTQECWVPHLKVDKYDIRKKALDTIAHEDAQKYSVLPVDKLGGILNLAMVNPLDTEAIRVIESKTGLDIKKVVATRSEIDGGIAKYYGGGGDVASDQAMNISQDLEPQRVTQMLNKVEAPDSSLAIPDSADDEIADIDDLLSADNIEDIDDLLGDDLAPAVAVAPAIIESISVDMDEIDDIDDIEDLDVVEPAITTTSEDIELDDMDLDLDEEIDEIEDVSIDEPVPAVVESVVPADDDLIEDISDLDFEDETDTDEVDVDLEPAGNDLDLAEVEEDEDEFAPSIAAAPEPEPELAPSLAPAASAPVAKASVPAQDERPASMLKKDPATSRFKASAKKSAAKSEITELTQVMEEEFQHAITHSKSHVFEKWSALQTRNRILNAVSIPKDMEDMLSVLDQNDKIHADVA